MIKSVHRPVNIYSSKCYYCICTACSERFCPWKDPCFNCHKKNKKVPKLDCDFFTHKYTRFYRFRKGKTDFTFSIFYKGVKIASGLSYDEMKLRIKGKPDYIPKIDKIAHPYHIW